MQYVQNFSLPPSLSGSEDKTEVKKLTEIKPVKPVPERSKPPQAFRPLTRPEHQYSLVKPRERRNIEASPGDRRTTCRRIKTQRLLKELRSQVDRRQKKQRKTDITEHINEEA